MNIEELWIGDEVYVISIGQNAIYEGQTTEGRILIKYNAKSLIVPKEDIREAKRSAKKTTPIIAWESDPNTEISTKKMKFSGSEIDLHLEALDPDRRFLHNTQILDYQLDICRQFVSYCISNHKKIATIIHGKGRGQLKAEVEHLLKGIDEVQFAVPLHDGALEVWFK